MWPSSWSFFLLQAHVAVSASLMSVAFVGAVCAAATNGLTGKK